MAAQKRSAKEYQMLQESPIDGFDISIDDKDMLTWKVTITGLDNTPYAGGLFLLHVTFPSDYPFKAPVLSFKTKIYHPNISNDDKGSMCLGLLRPDSWKPPTRMTTVLAFVKQILTAPEPDEAIEVNIAKEFKDNNREFTKKAKDWTKKYAKR
ncbi:RNA 3'-terminal phosphate cyclase [Physcia stellaris]|nr:RNA 3'-terminal phosphate cyclase [Physcia stellaris]